MIYAVVNGRREAAAPGTKGVCPSCGSIVIACCGAVNAHHWRHETTEDCDSFSEGITPWHIEVQGWWPEDQREVVLGNHRADIKTSSGLVVEAQHSPISFDEVEAREQFYKRLVWILHGSDFWHNFERNKKENYITFKWKWARATWIEAINDLGSKVFIHSDINSKWLFEIKKLHDNRGRTSCGGYGRWVHKDQLVYRYSSKNSNAA